LAKIVLILTGASLIHFVIASLCEIIIGSLGLLVVYQRYGGHLGKWKVRRVTAVKILWDCWPLMLSGIASMIYLRIDQVMLGQMIGSEEVGIYSVAVQLTEAWYFVPMLIFSSVFPAIVEAKEIDDSLFYQRLQKLYNWMALSAYIIAIPVCLFSQVIVRALFGQAYDRSADMLSVLIWSILFTNLGVARSTFLMAMNWTRVHFFTVALGCVINISLNLLLIPVYKGMGAVIASCVAYWFASHGSCFVYRPLFKTGRMLTNAIVSPKVWD
jgi:O-antigen/teichoic acid export membrane protein